MDLNGIDELGCEGDTYNEQRKTFIARMEAQGFIVNYPASNELMLDLDNERQVNAFLEILPIFVREMNIISIEETESRNGGTHIYIKTVQGYTDESRIAWQAALGSDPVREMLSLVRLQHGDEFPTILVEKTADRKVWCMENLLKDSAQTMAEEL